MSEIIYDQTDGTPAVFNQIDFTGYTFYYIIKSYKPALIVFYSTLLLRYI